MSVSSFGVFFAELRQRQQKTLRQFCLDNDFDPGNVSKLERGLVQPPKGEVLKKYAYALGLKKSSTDWQRFMALAATSAGKIPENLQNEKAVMSQLPVLFMALAAKKPSMITLKRIIKLVRES